MLLPFRSGAHVMPVQPWVLPPAHLFPESPHVCPRLLLAQEEVLEPGPVVVVIPCEELMGQADRLGPFDLGLATNLGLLCQQGDCVDHGGWS